MAIEVVCPDCDTKHRVKDESAGKKLKCKGCQKVLPIPVQATDAEADPWENLDENEGGEDLPPIVRQPAKSKSGKKSKSSSRGGMPIPIIGSIVINSLQIVFFLFAVVVNLIAGEYADVTGSIIRVVIDVTIINGLTSRRNRIRWNAILLDACGAVFAVLCGAGFLVLLSQGSPLLAQNGFDRPTAVAFVGVLVIQIVFWIVDLVLLFTPSAKEWCSE